MTTATQAIDVSDERPASWLAFLREALAPTPGHLNATIRIVVATSIVLATSMALEVPSIGISLFVVLFLTMLTSNVTTQNSVAVAVTGVMAILVVTFVVAFTILLFCFTLDRPPLRLAAMTLALFLGMFALRVFAIGLVGFLVAVVVPLGLTYVDFFPGPEPIVRGVLWIWVAVAYPAVITIGVNLLLLPADPGPLLRREIAARLLAVARAIAAPPKSADARRAAASLSGFAALGTAPLLALLRLAKVHDSSIEPLHAERTARILLLGRLMESAALLASMAFERSPGQQARLARVGAACEQFAAAVSSRTEGRIALPPAVTDDDTPASALTPVVAELERVILELTVVEHPGSDQPSGQKHLLLPDAFTNPVHAQFALKATLAGMLCYVTYTALDWNGIHTSMLTCVIVALGSVGAAAHKAALRFAGCAIGSALALAATVFVVPHMTSIVQLMLLVAAVTAPAAWIAMGGERIAYLGIQLAFAFYLAVLQGFSPVTDVTEIRDRLIGIFFGIAVMALVFAFVWPELAGSRMRVSVATALRRMSGIALRPGDRQLRNAAWYSIDEASQLDVQRAFESESYTARGSQERRHMQGLLDLTRRALLALTALDRL